MNNFTKNTVFITGGCGMVGSHLVDRFYLEKTTVIATHYTKPTINLEEVRNKATYLPLDVRDDKLMFNYIEKYMPSIIFHLAAQSYPTVSWENPRETIDININGTINVFEAIKKLKKTNKEYDPIVVIACSSAEYGASLNPENTPVSEDIALLPLHPYGVSKVGQDLLGYQYFINDNIRCIRARIFNTTGPRKIKDVASDFTKQAVLFEKGLIKSIKVGNLNTQRAITDVRDLIDALILLSQKGKAGEVYNICGKEVYKIKDILILIEDIIGQKLPIEQDPTLLRSTDEPIIFGDSSRLKNHTGWEQKLTLKYTLKTMIDYWRETL